MADKILSRPFDVFRSATELIKEQHDSYTQWLGSLPLVDHIMFSNAMLLQLPKNAPTVSMCMREFLAFLYAQKHPHKAQQHQGPSQEITSYSNTTYPNRFINVVKLHELQFLKEHPKLVELWKKTKAAATILHFQRLISSKVCISGSSMPHAYDAIDKLRTYRKIFTHYLGEIIRIGYTNGTFTPALPSIQPIQLPLAVAQALIRSMHDTNQTSPSIPNQKIEEVD